MKTKPKSAGAKHDGGDRPRASLDGREAPDLPPCRSCGSATEAPACVLRWPAVQARIGVSKVTVWRWRRAGKFPEPVQLGPHVVAWPEAEIDAWLAAKLAARDRKVTP
jgi:prophage regulatory protein